MEQQLLTPSLLWLRLLLLHLFGCPILWRHLLVLFETDLLDQWCVGFFPLSEPV